MTYLLTRIKCLGSLSQNDILGRQLIYAMSEVVIPPFSRHPVVGGGEQEQHALLTGSSNLTGVGPHCLS